MEMTFNWNEIEETIIPNFYGGKGRAIAKMMVDGNNRILKGTLEPGCSIGVHTHEYSSEIVYALEGEVITIEDGIERTLKAGQIHYCPMGHSHGMENKSDKNFVMIAVVPQHKNKNV